jgi:FkbM family methyltransferase
LTGFQNRDLQRKTIYFNIMQDDSFGKNILRGIRLRLRRTFHNPYRTVNLSAVKKIYYKHLTPGKPRVHRLSGKNLFFVNPAELLHGLKEIFVDCIYKQTLPSQPYIIDCGANIGLSIIYMKRLYPEAEILAFEPDEQNFKLLQKNVESFELKNITLRQEAVWSANTMLQFVGDGSMSSRIDNHAEKNYISVKAIRLKDFLNRKVDFLKIDIEGAEYEVIKDAKDGLHFVKNLFLEYHGTFAQNRELNDLLSIVVNHGFSYYIKEAASIFAYPFEHSKSASPMYEVQLNIFCFRTESTNPMSS